MWYKNMHSNSMGYAFGLLRDIFTIVVANCTKKTKVERWDGVPECGKKNTTTAIQRREGTHK